MRDNGYHKMFSSLTLLDSPDKVNEMYLKILKRQQLYQFLPRKCLKHDIVRLDDGVHEGGFFSDHGVDLFFQCAFGDEFEDLDATGLANAVDAVGGLVFPCGVPPSVIVDDN